MGSIATSGVSIFSIDPGDGKPNATSRSGKTQWLRNVGVPLYNDPEDSSAEGDEIGVVTVWTPPDAQLHDNDNHSPDAICSLQKALSEGLWFTAPQKQSAPNWVGVAVADAFQIDKSGHLWKDKARARWRRLITDEVVIEQKEISPDTRHKVNVARPKSDWMDGCEGCEGLAMV